MLVVLPRIANLIEYNIIVPFCFKDPWPDYIVPSLARANQPIFTPRETIDNDQEPF